MDKQLAADKRMQKILVRLMMHHGFFAPGRMRLDFRVTDKLPGGCATACTDGIRCWFHIDFLERLTDAEALYVVMHEIVHCYLDHPLRGRHLAVDEIRQIAADAIVNFHLDKYAEERGACPAPLTRPKKGVHMHKYGEWDLVSVYNDLMKNAKVIQLPGGGKGYSLGNGQEALDAVIVPEEKEDGSQLTAEERDALGQSWQDTLMQAATIAKMQGTMPGTFSSLLDRLVATDVSWREELFNYFTDRSPIESTWSRFSRRSHALGMYLPGMEGQRIDKIMLLQDTSGSMSEPEVAAGLGALNECLEQCFPNELWFVQWDAQVTDIQQFSRDDLPVPQLEIKGRGGTVIEPVFRYVREEHDDTEIVIVITDGGFNVPEKPPFDVLWLCTQPNFNPGYGKVIHIRV